MSMRVVIPILSKSSSTTTGNCGHAQMPTCAKQMPRKITFLKPPITPTQAKLN